MALLLHQNILKFVMLAILFCVRVSENWYVSPMSCSVSITEVTHRNTQCDYVEVFILYLGYF
jgi:hypothetical protein